MHKIFLVSLSCVFMIGLVTANAFATTGQSLSYNGIKIISTIRTNSSTAFQYDSHAQITCHADEILTGGGYKSSFKDGLSVFKNGPSEDGKKWQVVARYTAGSANGGVHRGPAPPLEIYGICIKITN